MQSKVRNSIYSIVLAAFAASIAHADEVEGLITFAAGTPARASEVNDNFAAVKTAVDGTHADFLALQQTVASLQDALAALSNQLAATEAKVSALETDKNTLAAQLDGVRNSEVMALDPYLTVTGGTRPTVLFSGVNLQIVNGKGATDTWNGLGNLIVGYDELSEFGNPFCSLGELSTQPDCESAGGVWSLNHKSGSHYVVAGRENNYSQFGGIVAGSRNASTGPYASVTGGTFNIASGIGAAVNGGHMQLASGNYSSVSGGDQNVASGSYSSISGGGGNTASDTGASVSGGEMNTASGFRSIVTGGQNNVASGYNASITGGALNTASGNWSSVTGGTGNTASGVGSSASGGNNRTAAGMRNWVAGSLLEAQ